MDKQVRITRDNNGTLNGVAQTGRVYITGPHFGGDIFSGTSVREQASTFTRDEARRLLALGKWAHLAPHVEDE